MKTKCYKNSKGITLIGLIVTIIVMLLLVGITINISTKKSGVLKNANIAKNKYNLEQAKEEVQLKVSKAILDYQELVLQNGKKNIISLHDYISSILREIETDNYELSIGTSIINISDNSSNKNSIAGTINDDGTITWLENVPLPSGIKIGSTVSYTPTGATYTWPAEKVLTESISDSFKVQLNSNTTDKITEWKVLWFEKNSGIVKIVPANTLTTPVFLQGANAYNNCVYVLDEACRTLYSNPSFKTMEVRNIGINDIEALCDSKKLIARKKEVSDIIENEQGEFINDNFQRFEPLPSEKSYYPSIYEYENKSVIDGIEKKYGWHRSRQDLIFSSSEIKHATSIQPFLTYFFIDYNTLSTTHILKDENCYKVLCPKKSTLDGGEGTFYWISGRCVNLSNSTNTGQPWYTARFSVFRMNNSGVGALSVYDSNNNPNDQSRVVATVYTLFPIITLSAQYLKPGTSTDFVVSN